MSDALKVTGLIKQGSTAAGLKAARVKAKQNWARYPSDGCAYHLSALMQNAGIPIATEGSAGELAKLIERRGWKRVPVGQQQAGDIGVTYDRDPTPPGADHVYLVIRVEDDGDGMVIADNQRSTDATHGRFASGKGGKTPTEYFLRAD